MEKLSGLDHARLMGMARVPGSRIRCSEHFEWDEEKDEIVDRRPPHTSRPSADLAAAIDVYDDRVVHWFLEPVRKLVEPRNPIPEDYIVTATLLAYFEGAEAFRRGEDSEGKSKKFFKASASRILEISEDNAGRLYKYFRCGLFHLGFTYGPAYVAHKLPVAVGIGGDGYMRVDPYLLYVEVHSDHKTYIQELRAGETHLQPAFEKLWKILWERS